jgi:general secretion pathway protein J
MISTAHGQSGFTLVEAMVSLFVFALLAAGCVTLLKQSVDTQSRVAAAEASLRELQTARAMLAADVAQVVSRPANAPGAAFGGFEGVGAGVEADRHMVLFRGVGALEADSTVATSLLAVEYQVDEKGRLVRRTRDALLPGPNAQMGERRLLEGARDVRFEFFDGLAWRETWPAQASAAPQAVAILANIPRYGDVRLSAFVGLR